MLDELHIQGLGVIEDASLRLSPGLTVVTGETGAGKTMLVTALQLLLGGRADTSLVRAGVDTAIIEARVAPPPPSAYEEGWLDEGDSELVVVREVASAHSDGRSRARIAGRLATVSTLEEVLGRWVEVHAQGSHLRLGRADVQRALLDRYAGDDHGQHLDAYRETFARWQDERRRLAKLEDEDDRRTADIERLENEVAEIDQASLDPDTDADVPEEVERLAHVEQLTLAAAEAANALGEHGAAGPVGVAVAALRGPAGHDRDLGVLRDRVEGVAAELTDVRRDLRDYAETVGADEHRLEELRQRDRLLKELTRKYGDGTQRGDVDVAGVLAHAESVRERLKDLREQAAEATDVADRVQHLGEHAHELSEQLHEGRVAAAGRLASVVTDHLDDLGMPHATFDVTVSRVDKLRTDGADAVEFVLAANPGEPARPFAQAASGGERSRVALAIEVALADVDDARVLVFDEVDAGVGGDTALAVGEKLARLAVGAEGRQVLCVTHLAQLAAFADVHHVVEKGLENGRTVTRSRRVDDDERPHELARMLSGSTGKEAGVEHARALLREAAARVGDV